VRGCVFVASRALAFRRLFFLLLRVCFRCMARWRWRSLAFRYLNTPCNLLGQERASLFASLESHMASSFGTFDLNAPVLEDEDGNGGFDLNEFPLETGNANVS